MWSEWAEESILIKQILQVFPLSPLLLPHFYFWVLLLLCTAPHYLNAWNRLDQWSLIIDYPHTTSTWRKTSQRKGANQQQTQPTYGFTPGTQVTFVGGRCSKVLKKCSWKGLTATFREVLTIQLEQQRLKCTRHNGKIVTNHSRTSCFTMIAYNRWSAHH